MESLPDDVLHQILQKGIQAGRLDHVDLCSLAIVNSHFDQLTQDPALWGTLLSHNFPLSLYSFEDPSKALYRRKHSFNFLTALRVEIEFEIPNTIFRFRSLFSELQFISEGLSATANTSARRVYSRHQLNLSGPLHEERDPVLPNASQPSLKEACNHYYENKPSKRFDKLSRPKVIPNSKSYIPMNRPPRRSMPRKI